MLQLLLSIYSRSFSRAATHSKLWSLSSAPLIRDALCSASSLSESTTRLTTYYLLLLFTDLRWCFLYRSCSAANDFYRSLSLFEDFDFSVLSLIYAIPVLLLLDDEGGGAVVYFYSSSSSNAAKLVDLLLSLLSYVGSESLFSMGLFALQVSLRSFFLFFEFLWSPSPFCSCEGSMKLWYNF